MKSIAKYIVLFQLIGFSHLLYAQLEVPKLKGRVTDQTNLLTSAQINVIEAQLETLEKEKGSQVVLLIVESTKPETIEQYSIRVADEWKIGRSDPDDGVLLLVAKSDRKIRIEVGYGLEGAIPDAIAKRIIDNVMVPHFRDGDYFLGIEEGLEAITALIKGEELPEVSDSEYSDGNKTISMMLIFGSIILIFAVVIAKVILAKKYGNVKSNLVVISLLFIVVWIIASLSAAIFASFFAFVFLNGRGSGGRGGGHYGGYSGYGGGFGGGGFSGGGGGFSGGGGGFGGGGASGGW
jgi:uncharacterized protein